MKLPIALSNKHVHLSQADVDALFGEGYQLTPFKPLSQPGQYACEEKVTVVGPKGQQTMRVLGPVRPESQVEVSLADARGLGIAVPVRQSGDVEGTPGCKLVGPKGEVEITEGVIIAARHIHLYPETAETYGLKDGDIVSIQTNGERALIMNNVLVRAGEGNADEVHIDTDEANACNLDSGMMVEIITK